MSELMLNKFVTILDVFQLFNVIFHVVCGLVSPDGLLRRNPGIICPVIIHE